MLVDKTVQPKVLWEYVHAAFRGNPVVPEHGVHMQSSTMHKNQYCYSRLKLAHSYCAAVRLFLLPIVPPLDRPFAASATSSVPRAKLLHMVCMRVPAAAVILFWSTESTT